MCRQVALLNESSYGLTAVAAIPLLATAGEQRW